MDAMIREFALQILRKLQRRSSDDHDIKITDGDIIMNGRGNSSTSEETINTSGEKDEKEQDHVMTSVHVPQDDLVQTPYLPERIELPAQKQQVLQHVELLFALSVKVPDFLDEYGFFHLFSSPFDLIYQNFQRICAHGPNRSGRYSRFDYSANTFLGIQPFKVIISHAPMPDWLRVFGVADPHDFHRTWATQCAACGTGQITH